jgi:3-isopropylmalate dehydrogenase
MLRYSLGLDSAAQLIEDAVDKTLSDGYRTYDIWSEGKTKVGTKEMGDQVAQRVSALKTR